MSLAAGGSGEREVAPRGRGKQVTSRNHQVAVARRWLLPSRGASSVRIENPGTGGRPGDPIRKYMHFRM